MTLQNLLYIYYTEFERNWSGSLGAVTSKRTDRGKDIFKKQPKAQ